MVFRRQPQDLDGGRLDASGASLYKRPVLKAIFTWWNGATIGATMQIHKGSEFIGEDEFGNRYFETRRKRLQYDGRSRRFVIYKGYADASKVPPDWHGWLHHTFPDPPTVSPLTRRPWEREHEPNLTGTLWAWRPRGSIARGGERSPTTGDYEPWIPD
jgi:NADH:ubiquinone oxidoreductase subunit